MMSRAGHGAHLHGSPASAAPMARLRDAVSALRAGLTASPGFRRWAARFALTRPVARREAAALFDLCAGFIYSQILAACVQLDVFTLLRDAPAAVEELAPRLGLPEASALALLEGAAALGLLARRADGRFALGPLGAAMIGNPGIAAMVAHHQALYRDLDDPVALLRRGRGEALAAYWSYAGRAPQQQGAQDEAGDGAQSATYTALMAASQAMVAEEVCAAYRFARHRCVLDIGGGDGSFRRAVAQVAPRLSLQLLDLPPVAAVARARFAAAGIAAQVNAGDFRADPLPQAADLITLVRVLHDHDDDVVRALLARVRAALPPGGRVLVAEPMAGTAGAERMGSAYFGLYLLAMGQGRPRRAAELMAMLAEAGFVRARPLRTRLPLVTGVLVAEVAGT